MDKTVVPRGNTQKGVNERVYTFLRHKLQPHQQFYFLDIPCGQGEFVEYLSQQYPQATFKGYDLRVKTKADKNFALIQKDFLNAVLDEKEQYDIIQCISGVMCFDGMGLMMGKLIQHLKPNGYFILTNDSLVTIRDRIQYLLFGHTKRFQMFHQVDEGNWNIMSKESLRMHFARHGLMVEKIEYCSYYLEDLIFLPLALVIYPIQIVRILTMKSKLSIKERIERFPLRSLFARHYIFYARRTPHES